MAWIKRTHTVVVFLSYRSISGLKIDREAKYLYFWKITKKYFVGERWEQSLTRTSTDRLQLMVSLVKTSNRLNDVHLIYQKNASETAFETALKPFWQFCNAGLFQALSQGEVAIMHIQKATKPNMTRQYWICTNWWIRHFSPLLPAEKSNQSRRFETVIFRSEV